MLDNQFQFVLLATEDRIRALQRRSGRSDRPTRRIFRINGERPSAREAGRR